MYITSIWLLKIVLIESIVTDWVVPGICQKIDFMASWIKKDFTSFFLPNTHFSMELPEPQNQVPGIQSTTMNLIIYFFDGRSPSSHFLKSIGSSTQIMRSITNTNQVNNSKTLSELCLQEIVPCLDGDLPSMKWMIGL